MTIRVGSYRDNPSFVRLPRGDWQSCKEWRITRGAGQSDVIREAVANAVAAVDPSLLLSRTPIYPLRQPLSISRLKLNVDILPHPLCPFGENRAGRLSFPMVGF